MSDKRNKILGGVAGATVATALGAKYVFPEYISDIKWVLKSNKSMKRILQYLENRYFIIDQFESFAAKSPKKPFIIYEDRMYSYEYIDHMANKVADLALTWKLETNDTVATMISNEPAFVWTLLGLAKVGLADAFVNYNLTTKPLVHSIKASGANVVVIGNGKDILDSFLEIYHELPPNTRVYVYGKTQSELPEGLLSMDDALIRSSPAKICKTLRSGVTIASPMCYVYTSGTTGLPKAAICNHFRAVGVALTYQLFNFSADDVMYIVTPLYHSAALYLSLFNSINVGATVVLRNKFSASHYFEDVRKHDVTVIQYIGELFRYILTLPESPLDGKHKVRVAFGNGLRTDIWEAFQKRFQIPWIIEFFGATEGTGGIINQSNRVGSCGRLSPLAHWLSGGGPPKVSVIKYDPIKEQVLRDKNGFCIPVKPGGQGVIVSIITPLTTAFYRGSKEMNEKKTVRNVFVKGDAYFNFGDMVYLDKDYYVYFKDRVGDTFRWKGENVSTREVCDVLSLMEEIQDVNVYGVHIPGTEGRAGMAAIKLKQGSEVTPEILSKIYQLCLHDLPSYARPLFLRFQEDFVVTTTMKHRKVELVSDGFDPQKISDPLFVIDNQSKSYTPLTVENMKDIIHSRL